MGEDSVIDRLRAAAGFVVAEPPEPLPPVEQIIARREADFVRKKASHDASLLLRVDIKLDGVIGICHFGDPHVDDDGCDLPTLRKHVDIVNRTPGMLGGNVGDLQNNWIGRLARLWAEQGTSAREAWALTEWLVGAVPWLYLVRGNHDCFSGTGDPLDWLKRIVPGVTKAWGARLALRFPNGREVRVNARHDFRGHSMWNPVHGPAKAVQMGWRDHILTCGHLHIGGYNLLKCPATGLLSHAIRVAGYKVIDSYAEQGNLPNQNISPACVTVIDPSKADDHPGLVTVFWDVETAADFLSWRRGRRAKSLKAVRKR